MPDVRMAVKLMDSASTARLKAELDDTVLSMAQMGTYSQEMHKCFQNILRPLSLFSHTDRDDVKKRDRFLERRSGEKVWREGLERRSGSSSSEEIMNIPTTLSELQQQLRARVLQLCPEPFCPEDQEALVSLMMSELGLIWRDLCGLRADPALTPEENRWLRCRTFGEVLCICERLCLHYLHLLDALSRRGIFSRWANRSRLAARMVLDLSSLLNVHSIRRGVAMAIKATHHTGDKHEVGKMHDDVLPGERELGLHVKSGCKKCTASRQQQRTVEKDLIEIQEKIGALDLERVYKLMPCHLESITSKTEKLCTSPSAPSTAEEEEEEDQVKIITRLKGCNSMPELQRETLLEELEMSALPERPQSSLGLLSKDACSVLEKHITPAEDLMRSTHRYTHSQIHTEVNYTHTHRYTQRSTTQTLPDTHRGRLHTHSQIHTEVDYTNTHRYTQRSTTHTHLQIHTEVDYTHNHRYTQRLTTQTLPDTHRGRLHKHSQIHTEVDYTHTHTHRYTT